MIGSVLPRASKKTICPLDKMFCFVLICFVRLSALFYEWMGVRARACALLCVCVYVLCACVCVYMLFLCGFCFWTITLSFSFFFSCLFYLFLCINRWLFDFHTFPHSKPLSSNSSTTSVIIIICYGHFQWLVRPSIIRMWWSWQIFCKTI